MESGGENEKITVSESTKELLEKLDNLPFSF
jgi:hypothetical protein